MTQNARPPLDVARSCHVAIDSLRDARDRAVRQAHADGVGPSAIADETGISRGAVRYILDDREDAAPSRTEGYSRPEPGPDPSAIEQPIFVPGQGDQA